MARRRGLDTVDALPGQRGMNGRGNFVRGGLDANTVYSQAIDLKSKGDCKGASDRLRMVAASFLALTGVVVVACARAVPAIENARLVGRSNRRMIEDSSS